MSRVAVWFDGGGRYGFGNVRRSASLAQALMKRGHEVALVALSPEAAALCPLPLSELCRVDAVLLDVPYAGDAHVSRAHELGMKVLALDYDGTVAPEISISLQSIRRVPAATRALSGVEYAIIREELRALGTVHETSDAVLVVVGGGDFDGLTQRIVERLLDVPLCIVQGPAGAPFTLQRDGLRVVTNPPDLPQIMAQCAWAVTTGGTTMLEMLSLGKAIHVIPRTEAEQVFAQRFADQGALLGMGLDTLRPPDEIKRQQCQQRGPQLVDGRGCERIAAVLESLI
jgi:spore coat polysaccharide biosynthesis predicted glycosyltransferase SpsG